MLHTGELQLHPARRTVAARPRGRGRLWRGGEGTVLALCGVRSAEGGPGTIVHPYTSVSAVRLFLGSDPETDTTSRRRQPGLVMHGSSGVRPAQSLLLNDHILKHKLTRPFIRRLRAAYENRVTFFTGTVISGVRERRCGHIGARRFNKHVLTSQARRCGSVADDSVIAGILCLRPGPVHSSSAGHIG